MQQRSEETRIKSLDSAGRLFSTRGFSAASVDEIPAESGISKGAFYHHFESQQALFLALLDGWLQASRDKTIWEASIAPYRRYHKYFTSLIKKGVEECSFVEIDPGLASRMIVSTAMGLFLQSLLVNSLLNTSKEKRIRK